MIYPVGKGFEERHEVINDNHVYRHLLPVEAAHLISERDVALALERLVAIRGAPVSITIDHGTEPMSKAIEKWAYRRGRQSRVHPFSTDG